MAETLNLKGEALSSEHKRLHDSERVMGVRSMLNSTMQQMRAKWAADNAGDPTGATRPNEAAIDQHYITEWVKTCTTVMNSIDPVDVEPDAMKNWIAEQRAAKLRKENMAKPLHAIVDLEPMGFKLLGLHRGAALWASTECVVMVVPGGTIAVYLRPQGASVSHYMAGAFWGDIYGEAPDILLPDYTLGELTDYLMAQRRERPAHPDEAAMEEARKQLSPSTTR